MIANSEATVIEVAPARSAPGQKRIWVDLDNSPHVPFFRPIIEALRKHNHELLITARDAYQTRELLEFFGMSARMIGGHHGKNKVLKALGTCWRAVALGAVVRRVRPDLSVCHGSRACLMTSSFLRIPNLTLTDYEFVTKYLPSGPLGSWRRAWFQTTAWN